MPSKSALYMYSRARKALAKKKRRRQARAPTLLTLRKGFGFPDHYNTKLMYTEQITFSGSANPAIQLYNTNSLYDPNSTGAGHQPRYFDQLAYVYRGYTVTACKVDMEIVNQSDTAVFASWGMFDNNPGSITADNLRETKYGHGCALQRSTGGGMTRKSQYMTTAQIMGEDDILGDAQYEGTITSHPPDLSFFCFRVISADGITSCAVYVRFNITYWVQWRDQLDPGAS